MLNKKAGLPHRATCIKIMRVIRTLVEIKLKRAITLHATERIAPHSGAQCDIWSEKSMTEEEVGEEEGEEGDEKD